MVRHWCKCFQLAGNACSGPAACGGDQTASSSQFPAHWLHMGSRDAGLCGCTLQACTCAPTKQVRSSSTQRRRPASRRHPLKIQTIDSLLMKDPTHTTWTVQQFNTQKVSGFPSSAPQHALSQCSGAPPADSAPPLCKTQRAVSSQRAAACAAAGLSLPPQLPP